RAGTQVRLRGRHSFAVPGSFSEIDKGRNQKERPADLPGHRSDADRTCRRETGTADSGQVVFESIQEEEGAVAESRARRILGRAGLSLADRHDLQGDPYRAVQADPLGEPRQGRRAEGPDKEQAARGDPREAAPRPEGPRRGGGGTLAEARHSRGLRRESIV